MTRSAISANTWIERTCRWRCLAQTVLFGVAAWLAAWCTVALVDARIDDAMGPHPLDEAALSRTGNFQSLDHQFVRFDCRSAEDTGIAWVEGKRGSETQTPIWAVPCEGRVLLVKSSMRPSGMFVGKLRPLDSSLSSRFDAEDRKVVLPFVLAEGDPRIFLWIVFALLAAGTCWLGYLTVRSLRRALDPGLHPALARLAADGHFPKVAAQVESELAAADAVRFRGRVFTRSFVVDGRFARFDVRRWRDVVWAYRESTQHHDWFIPAGKTHELRIHFSDGARMVCKTNWSFGKAASEESVDEALRLVSVRAPWAVAGFDQGAHWAWRKDRAALVDAVAQRRAEIDAADGAA